MSYSYTTTEATTFSITHANYLASKVATDLKRMQRFYGYPTDSMIEIYEKEIAQFLKHGYLKRVSYGFKRDGKWIEPTVIYTASDLGSLANDDPGKIKPGKDTSGASFYSYLEYTDAWFSLSQQEKEKFEENLPIQRTSADAPGVSGYVESDKTYSSGGKALSRSSVRSYS